VLTVDRSRAISHVKSERTEIVYINSSNSERVDIRSIPPRIPGGRTCARACVFFNVRVSDRLRSARRVVWPPRMDRKFDKGIFILKKKNQIIPRFLLLVSEKNRRIYMVVNMVRSCDISPRSFRRVYNI